MLESLSKGETQRDTADLASSYASNLQLLRNRDYPVLRRPRASALPRALR
jgi:aspartate carbamoyltransferase catalytic subunit